MIHIWSAKNKRLIGNKQTSNHPLQINLSKTWHGRSSTTIRLIESVARSIIFCNSSDRPLDTSDHPFQTSNRSFAIHLIATYTHSIIHDYWSHIYAYEFGRLVRLVPSESQLRPIDKIYIRSVSMADRSCISQRRSIVREVTRWDMDDRLVPFVTKFAVTKSLVTKKFHTDCFLWRNQVLPRKTFSGGLLLREPTTKTICH